MKYELVSNEILEILKEKSKVYIVGHKMTDLDAFASSLCFKKICNYLNLESYIIFDDIEIEAGVLKIVKNIPKDYLIKSNQIKIKETDVLVALDFNKIELASKKDLFKRFRTIINIDHHSEKFKTIETPYSYIDEKSSSVSEMMVRLGRKIGINIDSDTATYLLAGIVLDTNSFSLNTTYYTFEVASYLMKIGADLRVVQSLFKENLISYNIRQEVIRRAKVINNFAITYGDPEILYRKESIARIADTLLLFDEVENSIAIARVSENQIAVSARGIGTFNIGNFMEKLGGGGSESEGAATIDESNILEVYDKILEILSMEGL